MSQNLLTAALTVLVGVFTFGFGQMFLRALLEPAMELRREIGRIAFNLVYYANKRKETAAVNAFREHAARLRELVNVIFLYDVWQNLFCLPSKEAVLEASADLIGHSNGSNFEKEICSRLRITTHADMVRSRRERSGEI